MYGSFEKSFLKCEKNSFKKIFPPAVPLKPLDHAVSHPEFGAVLVAVPVVFCLFIGTLRKRTAGRLRTPEWRIKMSRKTRNAQSRATFFRHSAVLSLPAVLLRKVPNDGPSTLRRGNVVFTLKKHQIFSVHTTPEKFERVAIIGDFRIVFKDWTQAGNHIIIVKPPSSKRSYVSISGRLFSPIFIFDMFIFK